MNRDPGGAEDLLRELAPQVLGALVRRYGQFHLCEDASQEALLAAALPWPAGGILRAGQAIGGGTPSTLAANAGSQLQTAHACRIADRPKSSAARCGSWLARASSQSSTYAPSPASQRAAAGDSAAAAKPAGAGYAYAKNAARG